MDIKFNVVHVVDFIIVAIFAFLYLGSSDWNLTAFMRIVIGFAAGVVFLALLMQRIIGRILQAVLAGVWTFCIMQVVPFNVWTRDSIIWLTGIGIILFLIFFQLHGQGVSDFAEWVDKRQNGTNTRAYVLAHGAVEYDPTGSKKKTVQVVNYYEQYLKVQNEFNSLSQELTQKYHMPLSETDLEYQKLFKLWDGVFSYMFTELKPEEAQKLEEFIASVVNINEMKRQFIISTESSKGKKEDKKMDSEIDQSLFNGCTDKESITKRYRQLMKTFHPDNQNGDVMMTQKIQKTYEKMLKSL